MHMVLEKQVALKMLHGEFARKPDLVERFMQEAKAASRIRHENVIDISDFGATPDGLVFFAMELLNGHDLHEEVARAKLAGHLLPWSRTKKIFLQICSALSAAHMRGIVHRDLKPENVYLVEFLGDPDFVKLLDFGIAKLTDVSGDENGRKLTKTGMLFGTPEYMSPEQARGEQVDHRVDIYAKGCILFQLCTNFVPFQADNFMGVLSQHLTAEVPQIAPETFDSIGAPREIGDIIDKALAKNRDERWQTIDDFAAAIREACGDPAPADKSQPMRAPNVAPVGATTRARTPTAATPEPGARRREPTGRVKTQWTGNLKVPEIAGPDESPAMGKKKSSLPLILGGVALVAAGVAVAVVMMNKGREAPPPPPVAEQPPAPQPTPTPNPPAPQPPTEPALPALVEIVLDSKPSGAAVTDLATGAKAKTPYTATIPGSKTPRQFKFELKGYGDSTVELVPSQPQIKFTQTLTRGATKSNQVTKVPDPTTTGGGAVTTPDTTPVTTPVTKPDTTLEIKAPDIKPPDPKPPEPKPPEPKKDDCPDDEQPCLKTNIPGMGK
jgi:serine/threonine-protein kinase